MSSNPLDTVQPQTPARPNSQATAVEQARAEAEVKAAVVVAQQCPRDVQAALRGIEDACQQAALASRAFFSFRRGTTAVNGASIHLAREIARCWGNIDYGIRELRRDDEGGESEMLAFAWDQQTNVRSSSTFIVPHVRFAQGKRNPLDDPRDVYENNANAGARRVREAIFAVVPVWVREHAIDLCHTTNRDGGGKPLAERISEAVAAFGRAGVLEEQLEAYIGRNTSDWTGDDVARTAVLFSSLARGEITREEAFGDREAPRPAIAQVDATQLAPAPQEPAAPAGDPDQAAVAPEAQPKRASAPRGNSAPLRRVLALLDGAGIGSGKAAFFSSVLNRPITDTREVTDDEADEIRANFDALLQDYLSGDQ